jgi:hypothetical protein
MEGSAAFYRFGDIYATMALIAKLEPHPLNPKHFRRLDGSSA